MRGGGKEGVRGGGGREGRMEGGKKGLREGGGERGSEGCQTRWFLRPGTVRVVDMNNHN